MPSDGYFLDQFINNGGNNNGAFQIFFYMWVDNRKKGFNFLLK